MLHRAAARKTGAHAHCYGAVRPREGRGGIEQGSEGSGRAGRTVWNWERSSVGFVGRMVENIDTGTVGCWRGFVLRAAVLPERGSSSQELLSSNLTRRRTLLLPPKYLRSVLLQVHVVRHVQTPLSRRP